MTRIISRTLSTLFALCLPVLTYADTVTFLASGDQAYVEAKTKDGVQKIYTETRGDHKALMVLGEKNNPELLKFAFVDGSKKIVTIVVEFRSQKGAASPGLQVDNEFIKSLSSKAEGFTDWQTRFSTFSEQPTTASVLTNEAFADPTVGITFVDGNGVFRSRLGDWLCHCKDGYISALCIVSATRCVLDNLCTVWDCVEEQYWTPECETALEYAKACLGEVEE